MKYYFHELTNKQGKIIRGYQNLPEKSSGLHKTVIIFHGFTSNMCGNKFIFTRLSRLLTSMGYQVIRFDFYGSGESDGNFSEMTLSKEIDDARTVFEFAKGIPTTDKDNIYLLGHSMGGLISTIISEELQPKGLILLAPAIDMYDNCMRMYNGLPDKSIKFLDHESLIVSVDFINDLINYDPIKCARGYDGGVAIIRGTEDVAVSLKGNLEVRDAFGDNAKFYELEKGDHSFLGDGQRRFIEDVIKDFLKDN